jgi:GntR family transcriptional regulator
VLRALRLLRDEGLLEFRRGQGVRVAGTPERGAVLAKASELLKLARHHGYSRAEVVELLEQLP